MNRVDDPAVAAVLFPAGSPRLEQFAKKGSVLVGDVHPAVAGVAGALTPVPGGVGPLTIALLMKNTLRAAEARAAVG
jgi:methylenetetrahydrofolate dehydrogenase (NADP+)/methenyltetrahydrofolate cyclohydrolase